jgi:hypothetical protein
MSADQFDGTTSFDVNSRNAFAAHNGELYRDDPPGAYLKIGNVLANQTLFWVGEEMGFGFYRAGNVYTYFTFDPNARGILDSIKLQGFIKGQLIDSSACISGDVCWFFVHYKLNGQYYKSVACIYKNGEVKVNDKWDFAIRGNFCKGSGKNSILFYATDDGIAARGITGDVKMFPDTEPFVDSDTILLPGSGGIYAIDEHTITLLKMR